MTKPPLILISPSIEAEGVEFSDRSISLSEAYQRAVAAAGGLPLTMPMGDSRQLVAECVRQADGILITGGDDIGPSSTKTASRPGSAKPSTRRPTAVNATCAN